MKSCQDWKNHGFHQDGVYFLSVASYGPLPVYCDQTTDGGGWVKFQRRQDGTVDFYRNWHDYKTGFGTFSGEFWLGNDIIHILTSSQGLNELRVDIESFNGTKAFAKYSNFSILGENYNYTLLVSGYSGTAGDSLGNGIQYASRVHNGMQFSTFDRDNDKHEFGNSCAVEKHGAWWYNSCYWSHLNGKYKEYSNNGGIDWYSWPELKYHTLKKTEMKIR
ncbi:ficolin-2-like [Exaiptasia diaphana]|uniref:Fibrinogen C-terminal domain-containing protein n=1 Tax=Exaiptasia diaphana TaxID=2652724 RepID=A0A913YG80_EXADI|nr:ficolin-2-like [Exaiptasia diaphana]